MKPFFIILLLIAGTVGCTKKPGVVPAINGKWELRSQAGGMVHINKTFPAGNGTAYQFTADGYYTYYVEGKADHDGVYTIRPKEHTIFGPVADILYFDDNPEGDILKVTTDTITLTNNFSGGYTFKYAKVN